MGLKENIQNKVKSILDEPFNITEVNHVPKLDDSKLTFGNTGLKFTGTVLYIDMRGSTEILNKHNRSTVAKLHMSFFHIIVKIANSNDGHVRSFNGDSALIFFQGNFRETLSTAVRCAMEIKFMLTSKEGQINEVLKKYAPLNFGIGIDHGNIVCTKVGIGGEHNRDLFWIGNCVNKSTVLGDKSKNPSHIAISKYVYENLLDWAKYGVKKNSLGQEVKTDMWNKSTFMYNGALEEYYFTSWHWEV